MIWPEPPPLSKIGGFLLGDFLVIWGIVGAIRDKTNELSIPKWQSMWSLQMQFRSVFPFRRLVSLRDATQLAYRKTQGTLAAKTAEQHIDGKPRIMGWYATAIVGRGEIPVFGFREHLLRIEEIPRDLLPAGSFSEDGTEFRQYGKSEPLYRNLIIRKSDLRLRIKEIKSWDG